MKRSHLSFVLVMTVTHSAAAQAPAHAPAPPPAPPPATVEPIDAPAQQDPAAPPPAPPMPAIDARAELDQRERAELTFERKSIHFGGGWRHGWVPLQGDLDRVLDTEEFLATVGRPDLAQQYDRNRKTGTVIAAVSAAGLVTAGILLVSQLGGNQDCQAVFPSPAFSTCVDNNIKRADDANYAPGLVLAAASVVGILVGAAYAASPVNTDEAKNLADAYNQRLRRQLGLPTAASRPWLRDVKLAPYVARGDAGLALGARF